MNNKFAHIPADTDTTILIETPTQINGIDALHQTWVWDGIQGQSLIFAQSDLTNIDPTTLKTHVIASNWTKNKDPNQLTYTVSESGYVFINFDFETTL